MARAQQDDRIIYTRDADFLRLDKDGHKHRGIFYHHALAYSISQAIQKVALACEVRTPQEMENRAKFL